MRTLTLLGVLALSVATVAHAGDTKPDPAVARRISADELQKRIAAGEKPIVLDTRVDQTDVVAHGAAHVTNDQITNWAKDVRKDALIVAYCT